MNIRTTLATIAFASGASAQSNATFLLTASNEVTPASPSTTISIYAAWDQPNPCDFIFGAANYDLVAAEGEFTSATLRLSSSPPNRVGVLNGNRVDGAAIGQLHIPAIGIFGNTKNVVLLVDYEWTTTDFTARSVDLTTENTTNFSIVPPTGGVAINMVDQGRFVPGSGSITVVPAPSTLTAFAAVTLVAARRRR